MLIEALQQIASHRDPYLVYTLILHHVFRDSGAELDENQIVKSATGIRNTAVWTKLFTFQRDGVVGAIDKLNRFGGCIIADSVGLGKTFEALAIIKYHELRNDRVLVLCPKRLRDNWTLYKTNNRRNFLAPDRFNYDVLNHTDLSRDGGLSGDIDLAHVNWGNYDLVVIDESHNFRNKRTPQKGGETRYDRLMRKIIREGVKTRVLMLTATPVNNRLADDRQWIAIHSIAGLELPFNVRRPRPVGRCHWDQRPARVCRHPTPPGRCDESRAIQQVADRAPGWKRPGGLSGRHHLQHRSAQPDRLRHRGRRHGATGPRDRQH